MGRPRPHWGLMCTNVDHLDRNPCFDTLLFPPEASMRNDQLRTAPRVVAHGTHYEVQQTTEAPLGYAKHNLQSNYVKLYRVFTRHTQMHDKKEEQLCHTVPKLCTAALQTKSQQLYHIYNVLFSPLRAASCFIHPREWQQCSET